MNVDMGTYRLFQFENYIRIYSDYNGYTNTKYTFVYSFIFSSGSYHAHLIFIALNSRSHTKELSGNTKNLYLDLI